MKTSRLVRMVCAVSMISLAHCGGGEMGNDGGDAGRDAGRDAAHDAGGDGARDGGDAAPDAVAEAGPDVVDGGSSDAGPDGAPDASEGGTADAGPNDAGDAGSTDDAGDAGAPCATSAQCDDNNACTVDSCSPTGQCSSTPLDPSDNDACTVDSCDPATGVAHALVNVDDSDACTVDSCDPATGVSHAPVPTDDGDACTADSCDPITGVSHTSLPTDDGNACTLDACDPATGVSHAPVPVDDGNACTLDACDPASGVTHAPVAIDDGNACTLDACDPATGPIHTPVAVDDSVACTVDACDMSTGTVSHTPSNSACEQDGFSCTVPSCDPSAGCSEAPSNAACDDGNPCTADRCAGAGGAAGTGCANVPTDIVCPPTQVCRPTGCAPATAADQAGHVIITEFTDLGVETIEIHNTTAAPVDVRGYLFTNRAGARVDVRAASDRGGSAGTPVVIDPGGDLVGVVDPPGSTALPPGVGFVLGDPGATWSLGDGGDVLSLYTAGGATLEDLVDFSTRFHTDPNAPVPADAIPGFAGVSTQLDPAAYTAAGNDAGANWCTSFFPAGGARVRVGNTFGAPNGSCSVAVINEALIDSTGPDDGNTFVEIAGPGGGQIGGARIKDMEGKGTSAGSANSASATIPTGFRIPVDGLLVVADGVGTTGTPGNTNVPNVTASDLVVINMDPENSGGDALQLVSAAGMLLDVVGDDPNGAPLDRMTDTTAAMLALYESTTALYPPTASSLARATGSADTDNNRADFHGDPTPTPGAPNDPVNLAVTAITPNNGLATTTTPVTITGSDFAVGATAAFGSNAPVNCSVTSPTRMTCTAPSNAGGVARVNVTVSDPASIGAPPAVVAGGFTYTGVLNESDLPAEADYCTLQFPATLTVTQNTATPLIYGRIYEGGVTEAGGGSSSVLAEVGYGPSGSNPTTSGAWQFFPTTYNTQYGNDDEYRGAFTAPAAATSTNYAYTYRFSLDGGLRYTYCDLNGAGSNAGFTFEPTQLGVMTVTP